MQLLLDFSHEGDNQKMEGLDSKSHHMVEGELNEVIINIFLQFIDVFNLFLITIFFTLLLVDFCINLILDSVDILFVLSRNSPLIVKDFQ